MAKWRRHADYVGAINRIFDVHYNNADRIRYEIRYGHRNAYVTGSPFYTRNAYWQVKDLRKAHTRVVHLKRTAYEYTSLHYSRRTFVRSLKAGTTLHIKQVFTMGNLLSEMTRFKLTNGHYVTANRNYIKLI